jgi:transcriptional regulator GlxA family with amidase domain
MVKKRANARLERHLMKAWAHSHHMKENRDPITGTDPLQRMMQRFHSTLNAAADQPVYVLEIAMAIGTTPRSLSICCEEYLGIGLERYLLLRRLHLARQPLCAADPASATTVPDVATRYGFWQFSRFSTQYKLFYGELPTDTLRRMPKK